MIANEISANDDDTTIRVACMASNNEKTLYGNYRLKYFYEPFTVCVRIFCVLGKNAINGVSSSYSYIFLFYYSGYSYMEDSGKNHWTPGVVIASYVV